MLAMPFYKGIVCSVGLRTTGSSIEENHICQISILPLTPGLEPREDIKPFNIYIQVPKEYWTNAARRVNAPILPFCDKGFTFEQATEQLWHWWTKQVNRSQIHPLAHRWAEKRDWLSAEISSTMVSDMFSKFARDTHVLSQFANDRHELHGTGAFPFNRVSLTSLARELNIDIRFHTQGEALNDAILTAKVYKAMLNRMHIPSMRLPSPIPG